MLNITYCRSDRGVGGGGIGVSAAAFAAATALLHLLIFLLFPLVFRPAVLEPHFHLKSLIGSVLRIIPYLRRIHYAEAGHTWRRCRGKRRYVGEGKSTAVQWSFTKDCRPLKWPVTEVGKLWIEKRCN